MRRFYLLVITMTIIQLTPLEAMGYGNDFSCSFGKQGACLDYGDKVCSSMAKCVSNDAVCFDSYTCNYKGFICKSKFDELAEEHDDLLGKCKNIASEHDGLVVQYNSLLRKYKELESCVSYASTLEEAQACY